MFVFDLDWKRNFFSSSEKRENASRWRKVYKFSGGNIKERLLIASVFSMTDEIRPLAGSEKGMIWDKIFRKK